MKKIITLLIVFTAVVSMWAQSGQVSLYGRIASKQDDKGIAGATVTLGNQDISTLTNTEGQFSFIGQKRWGTYSSPLGGSLVISGQT